MINIGELSFFLISFPYERSYCKTDVLQNVEGK